jgi:hypothetical protein
MVLLSTRNFSSDVASPDTLPQIKLENNVCAGMSAYRGQRLWSPKLMAHHEGFETLKKC